jgi:outer membrane protein
MLLSCLLSVPAAGQILSQPDPRAAVAPEQPASAMPAPPAPTETLEDAWQIALRCDQRLEASQWNLSAAESTCAAARAERLPSMTLGSDYIVLSEQPSFSLNLPPLGAQQLPFFEQDSAGFHGLVTQPLYTSGRITSGINAAQAGVRVNQADVSRTRLDIKMSVADAYVTVLRAVRIVSVAESRVTSLTAHNHDVTAQFERGAVKKNDLLASQVALADARQQAIQARNGLAVACAAYNRALGRRLADGVQLAELREEVFPGDVDELTRTALQLRPELAGLSAQARALREQAGGERAKGGPQVGVAGGYLYQQDRYVDPNGAAILAVGVEWNAIDMGRSRNRANAYCEKAEAVVRMRRDAESMIALDVRQKWLDLRTAKQRVDVVRQAVAQADENLRVTRERYQNQVGTNTEVLDAETLRVQAYTNFYNSAYESVLAGLRLHRAIGDL